VSLEGEKSSLLWCKREYVWLLLVSSLSGGTSCSGALRPRRMRPRMDSRSLDGLRRVLSGASAGNSESVSSRVEELLSRSGVFEFESLSVL